MNKIYKFLLILSWISQSFILSSQSTGKELLGAWTYEIEGIEGITIFTPTHVAWLYLNNNRPNLNGKVLSQADKAMAFKATGNIAVSTWKTDGRRASVTYTNSNDPANIGQGFSWDYEIRGDYCHYWLIQADGTRGFAGKFRKLASWEDKTAFSHLNGIWKYTQMKQGLYFHCANYGIWLIINDPGFKTATEEDQAHAFEVINGAAVIAYPGNPSQQAWHVLYSSDPRNEKHTIFTGSRMVQPDLYEFWYDDGSGKPSDQKWQIQRIN